MTTTGIVLAGGSGSRFQRDVNKVFLPLEDREMLSYSLDTMNRSAVIDEFVLVVRDQDRPAAERLIGEFEMEKLVALVEGGESRHQSEWRGLKAVAAAIDSGDVDVVVIHDGARPFMTTELLSSTVAAAVRSGGGVPGLPIDGPVYERNPNGAAALPHQKLRRMQTPQAFRARPLLEAYRRADADDREGVDTAETVGRYTDIAIEVVAGDPRNIKVTFVEDIFRAEEFASVFTAGAWQPDA